MDFLPFFLVLFAGIIFSALFRKFHLPWVVALILAGVVVGPCGIGVLDVNPTIEFMGHIGLIFLMFMAGLEIKFSSFKEFRSGVLGLAIINSIVPFLVGVGIGYFFSLGLVGSLLLGIIFISSSIAVVIPSLETNGILHTRLGRSIVSATVIEDILSLVLLSLMLQVIDPITALPLPVFYGLLFAVLLFLRWLLPRLRGPFSVHDEEDKFQQDLRVILAILIGTVVSFELLGLHPIIAGFFAGLVLADSIKSKKLIEKLRTISYGVFVPVFFIVVGANTDISVLFEAGPALVLVSVVVIGSMASKFISGWIGGRISGFSSYLSAIVGASTMPQLSTTLAVVLTAVELGLVHSGLIVAMVTLSMITSFISPLLLRFFSDKYHQLQKEA